MKLGVEQYDTEDTKT